MTVEFIRVTLKRDRTDNTENTENKEPYFSTVNIDLAVDIESKKAVRSNEWHGATSGSPAYPFILYYSKKSENGIIDFGDNSEDGTTNLYGKYIKLGEQITISDDCGEHLCVISNLHIMGQSENNSKQRLKNLLNDK